jgi:hypothetical protein
MRPSCPSRVLPGRVDHRSQEARFSLRTGQTFLRLLDGHVPGLHVAVQEHDHAPTGLSVRPPRPVDQVRVVHGGILPRTLALGRMRVRTFGGTASGHAIREQESGTILGHT